MDSKKFVNRVKKDNILYKKHIINFNKYVTLLTKNLTPKFNVFCVNIFV